MTTFSFILLNLLDNIILNDIIDRMRISPLSKYAAKLVLRLNYHKYLNAEWGEYYSIIADATMKTRQVSAERAYMLARRLLKIP